VCDLGAFDEGGSGLVGAAFAAGEFGFGGDEAAFAGGLEDGGAVALVVGLDALEGGDAGVEASELLLDLLDNSDLDSEWGDRYWDAGNVGLSQ
jgi:hypothetical protein